MEQLRQRTLQHDRELHHRQSEQLIEAQPCRLYSVGQSCVWGELGQAATICNLPVVDSPFPAPVRNLPANVTAVAASPSYLAAVAGTPPPWPTVMTTSNTDARPGCMGSKCVYV